MGGDSFVAPCRLDGDDFGTTGMEAGLTGVFALCLMVIVWLGPGMAVHPRGSL